MSVYKLSATLAAHSSDVRAVAGPTPDLILSASRDTSAISWNRASSSSFTQSAVYKAGSRYVNCVAYLPPSGKSPLGYLVAGGQDTLISVFALSSNDPEPTYSLIGHRENVCALHTTPEGTIISGSWDKTAIVWQSYQQQYILKGHAQSVWSVLALGSSQFLTGSADNTIKLWNEQNEVHTFTGHTEPVRALAIVPDVGFASAANDSSIRVWTLGGDVVYTLSGHNSFIYSLALLPTGEIISGGEDGTARVWRDGELAQTITHPTTSVWSVAAMPNGDIVTGCDDGMVRVFSAQEERWANKEDLDVYGQQVAKKALPSQQIGDVNKANLPGMEALGRPGASEGQTIMIRNNNLVEAYQWDGANRTWQQVGEVVDAIGSSRKQLYQGKEYDFVFDVDIQDGVPPLKLPYNASENAYDAAQRFLAANDLPGSYLDEIVRFIDKNSAGAKIEAPSEEYVDPWTGASRYRPPTNAAPAPGAASSFADPYTGSSRYIPPGSADAAATPAKILPVRKPLSFKQANVTAMRGKLHQLNQSLEAEISTEALSLSPQETKSIEKTFNVLMQAVSTDASPSTSPGGLVGGEDLDYVLQVAGRWPESQLFPVVDLTRLITAFFPSALSSLASPSTFAQTLLKASDWYQPWTPPPSKARETNTLLSLRAFANALQSAGNAGEWIGELLQELSKPPYDAFAKTQRVALATIALNISCILLQTTLDDRTRQLHLSLILKILQNEDKDPEAIYRVLVALGNLMSSKSWTAVERGYLPEVKAGLKRISGIFGEDRIRVISAEIKTLSQ